MVRIKHVKKTPAIATSKFSADELCRGSIWRRGTTGSVLHHKLMTSQSRAVDAITVGITVWGNERVWKSQEGRGHGRGRGGTARRRGRSIGQAIEGFIVSIRWWVRIKVKYSKPDTRLGQISSDGHFYGRESVIGECVRSGDDGQNVDSGR